MNFSMGVIGGGNISRTHIRAAMEIEGLQVTGIYNPSDESAQNLAAECGATFFSDWESFLAHRPMDFVAIGSPSGLHADQGIEAACHGLHVLTEKPMDVTIEKARALIEACSSHGRKLGVFFQDRVKSDIRLFHSWMKQGVIGKPLSAAAQIRWYRPPEYYSLSDWRGTWAMDGGGALMNQGIHTVDLLLWLLGPVKQAYARAGALWHRIEVEDTVAAVLEFENGGLATLEATTAAYPGYPRKLTISGSEGTVQLEHDRITCVDLKRPPADLPKTGQGDSNLSSSSPVVSDTTGHRLLLENFLLALQGKAELSCSGEEGIESVALVQAIYASARTGRPVSPAALLCGRV